MLMPGQLSVPSVRVRVIIDLGGVVGCGVSLLTVFCVVCVVCGVFIWGGGVCAMVGIGSLMGVCVVLGGVWCCVESVLCVADGVLVFALWCFVSVCILVRGVAVLSIVLCLDLLGDLDRECSRVLSHASVSCCRCCGIVVVFSLGR